MVLKKLAHARKYETGTNYGLGNSMSSTAVSTLFGTGGSDINVLQEYNGFAWRCINIRSELLSSEDLFVERRVGDKWQEDLSHDFNTILEGGEGQYDLSELLEAHSKSMDLYGESFWYFSKGERYGKPMGIYLLDPSSITVLVANQKVAGYIYQKEGDRIHLDLDEVNHYRIHDPKAPFRGYGPMQAAGWFVRASRYTITYINNFLENNAMPAGVVVAKEQVNDKDWELFKAEWKERHSGVDNAGKTGFVRGSDLDFVKTGLSLGEIDFEKMKNSSRNDVMVMFGISKPMMAIFDDINRASATTARQLAAVTLTKPALMKITRKLSKKVANWYGQQYRIGSTNPVPEDDETKLQQFDKGVGRWFTINEARAAYGKEPIDGGDALDTTKQAPVAPKSVGKIRIKNQKKTGFSYEMKESFRSETEDKQKKAEQDFWQKSNTILKDQKQMVLEQLKPKKIVDAHFDAEEEAKKLADETTSIFIGLAESQGQLAIEFVGNPDNKFVLDAVTEKYISDSVGKATLEFTKETQARISQEIADGLSAGESTAKIGKRIDSVYEDVLGVKKPGYRIERLARTEVIKTSNEITEMAYKQSGVVQKKEWFANPGRCEFCAALDGSVIQLGGTFVPKEGKLVGIDGGTRINSYENVNHPPSHPSCRCTLVPVIDD